MKGKEMEDCGRADGADDILTRGQRKEKDGVSLNGVRNGGGSDRKARVETRKTFKNTAWGVLGGEKKKWP